MIDVCEYFNIHPTTTHGAIAYLDRLQPNLMFSRFEWQMLAICCILISAKYNESEEDVPDLATLEDITNQKISNDSVLNYELWALKKMGWKLSVRTPMAFLSCYLSVGITSESDFHTGYSTASKREIDSVLEKQINALATLTALDAQFKEISASELAASIVFVARRNLNFSFVWNEDLVQLTSYSLSSLSETIAHIDAAYAALGSNETRVIAGATSTDLQYCTGEDKENKAPQASPTSITLADEYGVAAADKHPDEHMLRIASGV
jgi:Cyclin, N-terminal domain/Cyclin, C-terminal domain